MESVSLTYGHMSTLSCYNSAKILSVEDETENEEGDFL